MNRKLKLVVGVLVPMFVLLVVATALAGQRAGEPRTNTGRLSIYPYEAPFGPEQTGALGGRLQVFPYEAPFGPEQTDALGGRLQTFPYEAPFGPDESIVSRAAVARTPTIAGGDGFDWSDAAAGFGVAAFAAALVAGAAFAIRRRGTPLQLP